MLSNPTAGRRNSGKLMVLATIAVALPLTATRAIEYIDVPAPAAPPPAAAPVPPVAPTPAVAPIAPVAPVTPVAPVAPDHSMQFDGDGKITINGRTKDWKQLTPEEKAEVRRSISEAKAELARTKIDREDIQREVREAMEEARIDQEDLRRDLASARVEMDEAMREIDAHAADLRRAGQDPEQIKATVRASLKSVENIDVEAITRKALASVDQKAIAASVAAAEASIAKAQAEIERMEERFNED